MRRDGRSLGALVAALLVAGGATALPHHVYARLQSVEAQVELRAPAPDPGRGKVVAIFRGKSLHESDLRKQNIHQLIARPLIHEFIRANQLEPTPEQLRSFDRAMHRAHLGPALRPLNAAESSLRWITNRLMVQQWLLSKALYEQYGGEVIFQQGNPMEPVGAYRRYFEDHESRGTFKILDPGRHEEFWSYYRREHPMQLPDEMIDFSRPWWERG
jgi:hypothetical protein